VSNLGELRRFARSRAGESHAVVFDGPIPPKCTGAYQRAALGGGRLQEFRHLLRAGNFGAPPVITPYFGGAKKKTDTEANRHGPVTPGVREAGRSAAALAPSFA
jgi:hypothetical protein